MVALWLEEDKKCKAEDNKLGSASSKYSIIHKFRNIDIKVYFGGGKGLRIGVWGEDVSLSTSSSTTLSVFTNLVNDDEDGELGSGEEVIVSFMDAEGEESIDIDGSIDKDVVSVDTDLSDISMLINNYEIMGNLYVRL